MIVILALSVALMVRERRAARREVELQGRLAQSWPLFVKRQKDAEEAKKMQLYLEALTQRLREKYAQREERDQNHGDMTR
jgi:hypothetical protein